ncbi:MAG: hypothetical protein AAF481_15190 [Acidobacteriota bacterium]
MTLWLALGAYALAALWLGWRAGRATADREQGAEFWTAGRSLGAGSVGLSISAGFMSVSWSCVYAAQLFYGWGLGALWLITLPWLLSLLGIWWLARRYRDLPSFSQPEMVGERFGPVARRAVAFAVAAVFLIWGGAEIYVAASLLAPGLGVPVPLLIGGITLLVAAYATLGGFRAVVATDKLQYVVVAFYVLAVAAVAALALTRIDGGFLPAPGTLAPTSGRPWHDLLAPGGAVIALTFVAYLPGWLFETDLWVRVQAAKDSRAARRGVLLAGANALLFVGVLPLFIGLAALTLFPTEGGAVPAVLGNEGDAIFAALVGRYAPAWLAAPVAVGLVAAAMSTIDTCANVMALAIGYDLLDLSDRSGSRWLTLGVLLACGVFALFTESLWDLFYLSAGILTTAVAFPVAAVFLPWAKSSGVAVSSIAGMAGTVLAYFLETRGFLTAIQPAWLADSGLGYILWGILAAAVGYGVGARRSASAAQAG